MGSFNSTLRLRILSLGLWLTFLVSTGSSKVSFMGSFNSSLPLRILIARFWMHFMVSWYITVLMPSRSSRIGEGILDNPVNPNPKQLSPNPEPDWSEQNHRSGSSCCNFGRCSELGACLGQLLQTGAFFWAFGGIFVL